MIPIILLAIGLILSFRDHVNLSKNAELNKSRTKTLGLITIGSAVAAYFVSGSFIDPFSSDKLNALYYFAPILPPLIALFLLAQKKQTATPATRTNQIANIITWFILLGVVMFAFWLLWVST